MCLGALQREINAGARHGIVADVAEQIVKNAAEQGGVCRNRRRRCDSKNEKEERLIIRRVYYVKI